jgi:hypothetical protein
MQGLQLVVVTLAASAVKFTPPPDNKYHIKRNAEKTLLLCEGKNTSNKLLLRCTCGCIRTEIISSKPCCHPQNKIFFASFEVLLDF